MMTFILLKDEVDKKLVDLMRCLKFIKLYIKFFINYSNQKSKFNNYLLILSKDHWLKFLTIDNSL